MRLLLNTIPKSGTNVAQKLLFLINVPYSKRSLTQTSGWGQNWVEAGAKFILRHPHHSVDQPVAIGLDNPSSVSMRWLRRYLWSAKGYVSAHAAFSEPLYWLLRDLEYRIFIIVRHPGAVLYSWARYIGESGYYWRYANKVMADLSIEERFERLLKGGELGGVYYPPFYEIYCRFKGWLDLARNADSAHIHLVRFEDLVGSLGGGDDVVQRRVIERILGFLEIDLEPQHIDKVQANLFGGTHTFRSGQIDMWRSKIPDRLQQELLDMFETKGIKSYLDYLGYM